MSVVSQLCDAAIGAGYALPLVCAGVASCAPISQAGIPQCPLEGEQGGNCTQAASQPPLQVALYDIVNHAYDRVATYSTVPLLLTDKSSI